MPPGNAAATLAQFHAIVESAVDAIITIDADGRILFVNGAAERMFGHGRAALVGASIDVLLPGDAAVGHAQHLRQARNGGEHTVIGRRREIRARRRDGSSLPVEITVTRTHIDGVELFTGIVRDATDRIAARDALARLNHALTAQVAARTAELDAARHHAAASDRAKHAFLAIISHELRTPLNAIFGGLTLLLETPLSPEQQECAAMALQGAHQLSAIVEDVLTYTEFEGGDAALAPAPVDVRACAEAAVAALRATAEEKGLALHLTVDARVPPTATCDGTRLGQALRLLLGNALKFTDAGSVTLAVDGGDVDGAAFLRFTVVDTGIGIPPDHLRTIFRHFATVDDSSTRRHGGVGLGLSIAHRIATRMGGTLDVASIPERGSTFWLTVPVAAPRAAQGATNPV